MKLIKGDIWKDHKADDKNQWLFVTTNSFVKKNGELVMGRGFAKEITTKYPHIARRAGEAILQAVGSLQTYGILTDPFLRIGLFQVKHHWHESADLELIKYSTDRLCEFFEIFPNTTVLLNYPGIGNGRLEMYQVAPIIETLPDSVFVYYL